MERSKKSDWLNLARTVTTLPNFLNRTSFSSTPAAVSFPSMSQSKTARLQSTFSKQTSGFFVLTFLDEVSRKLAEEWFLSQLNLNLSKTTCYFSPINVWGDVSVLVFCNLFVQFFAWFSGTETWYKEVVKKW